MHNVIPITPGKSTLPMRKKVNFTKRTIAAMRHPVEGRVYVYDATSSGLAVCLSAAGSKTFVLYRKIGGRPERIRIGTFPETTVEQARTQAASMNGKIADGVNPNEKRRVSRNAPTLGQVFDEYLDTPTRGKTKRPRSATTVKDYRWQFQKYLEPWRERRLSKITRADVERLHNQMGAEHGQYMANRVLSLVKSVFNYAVECEYTTVNPPARLKPFEEQSRDRRLEAGELPRFWQAVESEPAADFFKLLLFTGARKGNVNEMRWEEADLTAATWRIPHTKSGHPLTIPLSPEAVALLKGRREHVQGDWVFPNPDGTKPMRVPRRGWARILAAAGIKDLRLHDLRRTLASWQASGGSSMNVIGKSLGHSSLEATKIYAHADLASVRQSVDAATAAIMAATKSAEGKHNG